jgi:hypothetical protein
MVTLQAVEAEVGNYLRFHVDLGYERRNELIEGVKLRLADTDHLNGGEQFKDGDQFAAQSVDDTLAKRRSAESSWTSAPPFGGHLSVSLDLAACQPTR